MTDDEAAHRRRRNTITRIIGEGGQDIADYHDLSDEDLLRAYQNLSCAHADAHDRQMVVLDMLRERWPHLFKPKPEPEPEPGLEAALDARCLPVIAMTQALLAIIRKHRDGDFPMEELKRIRMFGEEMYRLGGTVDLQIARSIIEEDAGADIRRRIDRIWYSDLERIPFDDCGGYFKGLD